MLQGGGGGWLGRGNQPKLKHTETESDRYFVSAHFIYKISTDFATLNLSRIFLDNVAMIEWLYRFKILIINKLFKLKFSYFHFQMFTEFRDAHEEN